MNAAPIAAIAVSAARRRVAEPFLSAGAFSADRAIAVDPQRRLDSRMFDRMARQGILRETADGRWWMDEGAMRAARTRRVRLMALALALLAAIYVVLIVLGPGPR